MLKVLTNISVSGMMEVMNDELDALAKATQETHPHREPVTHGSDSLAAEAGKLNERTSAKPNNLGNWFSMFPEGKRPNFKRRIAVGAGVAGLAVGAATVGANADSTPTSPESKVPVEDTYTGRLNDRVESIVLQDEARLRESPIVSDGEQGTNLVQEINLNDGSSIEISTPEGVYIQNDEANGSWYGIRVQNLPPELASEAQADKDGVVWVNTQTADPTYTVKES